MHIDWLILCIALHSAIQISLSLSLSLLSQKIPKWVRSGWCDAGMTHKNNKYPFLWILLCTAQLYNSAGKQIKITEIINNKETFLNYGSLRLYAIQVHRKRCFNIFKFNYSIWKMGLMKEKKRKSFDIFNGWYMQQQLIFQNECVAVGD